MKYIDSHTFAFMNLPPATAVGQNAFAVHLPPRAPDEVSIVRSQLVAQLWNPAIQGTNFLCNWIDLGSRYAANGFPAQQVTGSQSTLDFNILPLGGANGATPFHDVQFRHPVPYSKSRGDSLGVDLAYGGGGGDFYWQVWWLADCPQAWPTNAAPNGADDLNTRVLLNFDEFPSDYRDFSAWCHLTFINGAGGIVKTPVKFGKGALATNGIGGLSMVNAPDLVHGASDWTWETWVYPTATGGQRIIIGQGDNYSPIQIGTNGGNFYFSASTSGTGWNIANAVSMGAVALNTWQHLAVIRSGNAITLWREVSPGVSVQQGSAIPVSGALCSKAVDWSFGYLASGTTIIDSFLGYIGETRFSNVARNPALFPPLVSYGGA